MEFRILGPLEIRDGERLLALPGGRARKLLGMLLLHRNRPLSPDRLVDELWGDEKPGTAGKALQGYVSQLRKLLGPGALETRVAGYSLVVDPEGLDSERFERLVAEADEATAAEAVERLRDALALWRGPALADFAYDEFAQAEIARLEELRLHALEERIAADLSLGRHAAVVGELEALLREYPLRERLWGELMVGLYGAGRQAEALAAYATARKKLVEELGIEPGDELQGLQRAILAHDPALGSPPRAPRPGSARTGRLTRPRALAAAGALLLAGAVAAALVELTGGSHAPTVVPNSIAVVDAKDGRVVDDIPVGSNPIAVAAGLGGIWVANADDGTVTHIDPETRTVVANIGVGGDISDIDIGFGSVWVANGNEGSVVRIDPRLDAVERTIRLGGTSLEPRAVFQVAAGEDAVWATSGNRVVKIDPRTNRPVHTTNVDDPLALAVGEGAVWVTTMTEELVRIEPRTGRVAISQVLPAPAFAPTTGRGSLWAILLSQEIWRIDPATGEQTGTVASGRDFVALTLSSAALWVAERDPPTLTRIDAETSQTLATVEIGQRPTAIAAANDLVWVSLSIPV